ncbi:hypothetical protein [Halovulum sp. GXIMD14793]
MRTDDTDTQADSRKNRSTLLIIIVLAISSAAAFWSVKHAVPGAEGDGRFAFWIGAPVAVISFFLLLRAVVEMLVEPQIRTKRVAAYGIVIVSFMFMGFWFWQYLKS